LLSIIDTHTGGEPTRVVIDSVDLIQSRAPQGDPNAESKVGGWVDWLRQNDWIRRSLILEPRGAPWMVGAICFPATDPDVVCDIVFFNNTGYLGMCGHGLMGVVEALRHEGRIGVGCHRFGTPVGMVSATLEVDGRVSIENVASYRFREDAKVDLTTALGSMTPGSLPKTVYGDVAYGGNWFYLVHIDSLEAISLEDLTRYTTAIAQQLQCDGVRGADDAIIDHVELCAPLANGTLGCRSFVLCPGGHFDRSPCGTGTSAKMACLAASGKLSPGQWWRQESIIGSSFEGSYRWAENGKSDRIVPNIRGRAFVTAKSQCVFDPLDDFRFGFETTT
jgi:4-hydroxyproline epimerase